MWVFIFVSFLLIVVLIIGAFAIKKNKDKLLDEALKQSLRIKKVNEINEQFTFANFKDNFEYAVHFNDLDEFRTADLKLIKYSFFIKNRSVVCESIQGLNNNIELYGLYLKEIENAKVIDDEEHLKKYKVNRSKYHHLESDILASLIKNPCLKCSFNIYYDYSSSTGRSTKESDHFRLTIAKRVDAEKFLNEMFPPTSLDEYKFKPHYLNKSFYVHYDLLVSEETINIQRAQKLEEDKNRQFCIDFYDGKDVHYFPDLKENVDHYLETKNALVDYIKKQGLKYRIKEANKYEYFLIVEETLYLYVANISTVDNKPVSITNEEISNTITSVVELNYNPLFDYEAPKRFANPFSYYKFLSFSSIRPFEMAIERCKLLFPEIDIERINSDWEGVPASFIVYEINNGKHYGYSLMICEDMDNNVGIGRRKLKDLLTYEKNKTKKEKKMEIDKGNMDDLFTYDLTCSKQFLDLLKLVKEQIKKGKIRCDGDSIEEKILSQIVYYVVPFYLKDKTRGNIKKMKEKEFNILNHEYLLRFDSYEYINSHKKWKNEYSLYQLCKKMYGKQVVYQYRPQFLKTDKGQLSYDIYLSKYRIAIEYQGAQHFKSIDYFGGSEAFEDIKRRDELKKKLSIHNKVKLIEIKYDENITSELIKSKIDDAVKN